jgi:hypothetical protein
MKSITLFTTGFIQVFLIVLNTYSISHEYLAGVIFCGFTISLAWSYNVKRISISTLQDRIVYAFGALGGTLVGYFLGKYLLR